MSMGSVFRNDSYRLIIVSLNVHFITVPIFCISEVARSTYRQCLEVSDARYERMRSLLISLKAGNDITNEKKRTVLSDFYTPGHSRVRDSIQGCKRRGGSADTFPKWTSRSGAMSSQANPLNNAF